MPPGSQEICVCIEPTRHRTDSGRINRIIGCWLRIEYDILTGRSIQSHCKGNGFRTIWRKDARFTTLITEFRNVLERVQTIVSFNSYWPWNPCRKRLFHVTHEVKISKVGRRPWRKGAYRPYCYRLVRFEQFTETLLHEASANDDYFGSTLRKRGWTK